MALAALAATVFASPAAATTGPGTFSCKASALRVHLGLGPLDIEPFVANKPDVPCRTDQQGLINPTDIGSLLRIAVLSARTFSDPEGIRGTYAESETLGLDLFLGQYGLPAITVKVLRTSAEVTCAKGHPLFNSSSKVIGLRIGDQTIDIPSDGEPITLDLSPLVSVYINERIRTPTSITRRALRIHSDLLLGLDVVVSESSANVEGNPCGGGPTPPPPPPPPSKKPECSDKKDNDGDKLVDKKDPGCHSDGNAKNPYSYDPDDDKERNKAKCPPKSKKKSVRGGKVTAKSSKQCKQVKSKKLKKKTVKK